MIKNIIITNFKSVSTLDLSLGRVNVLIGSNGSGKSNILEAIAFGAAASADKLDNEFLGSRGIRSSEPFLMKSAFPNPSNSSIILKYKTEIEEFDFTIVEDTESKIPKWYSQEKRQIEELKKTIEELLISFEKISIGDEKYTEKLNDLKLNYEKLAWGNNEIDNFIIYSPEQTSLRKFEEESQIKPLGIKGEGLFNVLQIFNESYGTETINEIKKFLHAIEWFDDFEAIYDKVSGRKSLVIKDKYLPSVNLNQNTVNEGFLFILFYISLLISKETPTFFAIDNIEASFHPKLCEDIIRNIVELSKKYNKQIILTTHNPFILDGLNLDDEEQCLFVVRRNADGETIADKIGKQPKTIKLSEAWLRGYIGGNPETIEK